MPQTPMDIVIIGAGPVGLLTTLRLARAGIKVQCLDRLQTVDSSPRAMAYHPVATREIDRAGVLDDIRTRGETSGRGICWRNTKTGEVIAKLERGVSKEFPYENLVIGQHELAALIMEHLKRHENAEVVFERKVVGIDQESGDCVKLTIEDTSSGKQTTISATYVVAADGGRSTMRHLLGVSFEGFTYPEQLVSCNVYYDFEKYGWMDGNFLIDPEHWALIGRINDKGLWRVSYGEIDGLAYDELMLRLPWKFEMMFPGPRPLEYEVAQASPYRLNQRCADRFRVGKVVLAGDAAHLCNPFGGLGLTGGILDAGAVAGALIGIYEGKTSDAILDKYAEVRRNIFLETVNPQSQANKMRMHDSDPGTIGERDPLLKMLRQATPDEKQHVRQQAALAVNMSEFFDGNGEMRERRRDTPVG